MDYDDWYVTADLFKSLTARSWGVVTIDSFASEKYQKTMRFNSKHQNMFLQGHLEKLPLPSNDQLIGSYVQLFDMKKYKTVLFIKNRLESCSSLSALGIIYIFAINCDKI